MIHKEGITHFIRPGALSVDLPTLTRLRGSYDGFVMNAPTIADSSDRAAGFLRSLVPSVPFIIDPKTYALGHDPAFLSDRKGHDMKRSWKKLLGHYGIERSSLPLVPSLPSEAFRQLAAATVNFQKSCFPQGRQLSFIYSGGELDPTAVVAPYFMFKGSSDPWLDINMDLVKFTKREAAGADVLAVLLFSRKVLQDQKEVDAVANAYLSQGASGYLLWIDGAPESDLTVQEVSGVKRLIGILNQRRRTPVINMYGGYLSALLYHWGLAGFSHHLEGGEKRLADPARGGPTDVLFYLPPLRQMKPVEDVDNYLDRLGIDSPTEYRVKICGCQICQHVTELGENFVEAFGNRIIDLNDFKVKITNQSRVYATMHYLLARFQEIKKVQNWQVRALVDELVEQAVLYRDPDPTSKLDTRHLTRWAHGLVLDDQGQP